MRCTITGANGFIGRNLVAALGRSGHSIAGWERASGGPDLTQSRHAGEWTERLRGTEVVVHLAGRAHVVKGAPDQEAELHRRINFEGTARLAAAAQAAGVRRFIFLSTAKVLGEGADGPYSANSPVNPADDYARSKWQAEQALQDIAATGAMEVTILRPPLVYGPGVGANFERLVRFARLPLPLPIASVDNRRDLIGIDNLVDLIRICLDHPGARNATLLCSDGHPYSLAELVAHIRAASGQRSCLFAMPASWLEALVRAARGQAAATRLFGNFELDISATRAALGWAPSLSMPATLRWLGAETRT